MLQYSEYEESSTQVKKIFAEVGHGGKSGVCYYYDQKTKAQIYVDCNKLAIDNYQIDPTNAIFTPFGSDKEFVCLKSYNSKTPTETNCCNSDHDTHYQYITHNNTGSNLECESVPIPIPYTCTENGCAHDQNGKYKTLNECNKKCIEYKKCENKHLTTVYSNDPSAPDKYFLSNQSDNPCDLHGKSISILNRNITGHDVNINICNAVNRPRGCNNVDSGLNPSHMTIPPLKDGGWCRIGSIDPYSDGLIINSYGNTWGTQENMCHGSGTMIPRAGGQPSDPNDCSLQFKLTDKNPNACT